MIVEARKNCDVCGEVVATKHYGLFFTTDKEYMTVRSDKPAPWWSGRKTIVSKRHVCLYCWWGMQDAMKKLREEDNR